MAYKTIKVPSEGDKITQGKDGVPQVSNQPIIPFIEGDGTGRDIWKASQYVFDNAVKKVYGGKRKIVWMEVYAGEKAYNQFNTWLPDDTVEAFREYLIGIKGPLTTPVGGGIRSLNVALRPLDGNAQVARRGHGIVRKPGLELAKGLFAGKNLKPLDGPLAAVGFFHGCVEYPLRRLPNVAAGAVAFNKRNDGMIGDFELPVAVLNRLAVFGQFQSVVGLCHGVLKGPFGAGSKDEANTCKLGVAMAARAMQKAARL